MKEEKLLVTLEQGVKRITFNRPERRNSIDFESFELFRDACLEATKDESRVVIITGAGDAFCSGADLSAVAERGADLASFDVTAHLREHTTPAILAMRQSPKPFVARVHGPCVGIGFSYALACDVVIASEDATFGQGFIRVGLMPDGGSTFFLPRLVGYRKAFEMMATGEQISAEEALRLGVINRVVPFDGLDAVVDKLALSLAAAPQPALGKIKAAMTAQQTPALSDALDFEAEGQQACFRSADFLEGVTAFMQKRKPEFGKKRRADAGTP